MEDLEDDVEGNLLFLHPPKGGGAGGSRQKTGEREKDKIKGSLEKVQQPRSRNSRTKLRK